MEYYDVIIIGAGIAGCGLAYNLKRFGYQGSVLVIDKREVGANAGYGGRNTNEETIKKYNLKYLHVFDGIKVGAYDQTYITIKNKFYFIDYKKSCQNFINKSCCTFRQETAVDIKNKTLITDKKQYKFKYIVDASGHNFFIRKKLNKPIPSRYWIGTTSILKNKLQLDNYFYHQFSNTEYLEDLYPLKNATLHGHWKYVKKIEPRTICPPRKTLINKFIKNPVIEQKFQVVIPCSPVPPTIEKQYVCLGDSFGNAYTSSACGIQPIMESSVILANAIKSNNLNLFKQQWKKKYYNNYMKFLVSKVDGFHNKNFIKLIKKYPERTTILKLMSQHPTTFLKIFNSDDSIKMPKNIRKKFPHRQKLFQLAYWTFLKLKYNIEEQIS